MSFAQGLNAEEQRASREGLNEEELALFDLLTQPEPKLSAKEKAEVKQVARELLQKLKRGKLVLDWRLKADKRADVERTIRDEYRALPDAYSEQLRREKRNLTYAHIYDNYYGVGMGIYGGPDGS